MISIVHALGEYPAVFGTLAEAFAELPPNAALVTDENVLGACLKVIPKGLPTHVIRPGEASKNLQTYTHIVSWLLQIGANRKTLLLALGGGVVGDLAGFVAATYMRGMPYIQVPTSLMAQVDSSIGGKVGLDLQEGKNLVGAFYPPQKVFTASEVLETLPEREFNSGAAEVWKYAFALDAQLVGQLETQPLHLRHPGLEDILRRCIRLKASIVEQDEFETKGLRAVLNFGHSVGHAMEKVCGYGTLTHGEAISMGMAFETRIGEKIGITPQGTSKRLEAGLLAQGLPVEIPLDTPVGELLQTLRRDKKRDSRGLAMSLLTGIGACKLVQGIPEEVVESVF